MAENEVDQRVSSTKSKKQEQLKKNVAGKDWISAWQKRQDANNPKNAGLGVILGVFLPSLQNVFGIIMFLRLSYMVGHMGIIESFIMVFLCCLCTFLTSLSIGAITTNGKIGCGGPYFLISRSLGPGIGAAIGILFCMANTIAIGMYCLGGIEIILNYLFPQMAIGGREVMDQTGWMGAMTNSTRLYGTIFCIILFLVVLCGVRVAQMIAPLALGGVIVSIVAIYAGAIQKSVKDDISPGGSPYVCLLEGRLLQYQTIWPEKNAMKAYNDIINEKVACSLCTTEFVNITFAGENITAPIWNAYCDEVLDPTKHPVLFNKTCEDDDFLFNTTEDEKYASFDEASWLDESDLTERGPHCKRSLFRCGGGRWWQCLPYFGPDSDIQCIKATPGFKKDDDGKSEMEKNEKNLYRAPSSAIYDKKNDKSLPPCEFIGVTESGENKTLNLEVFAAESTDFFFLLAVYFPSVTGILTGANMSGDLANPTRDIPRGTIAAQLVTTAVYLSFTVLFGGTSNGYFLRDQFGHSIGGGMAAGFISYPHPYVVYIGALLSTFGAGVQSLVSAPRLLQAIASDDVLPFLRPFAAMDKRGEPLRGQVLLFAIGLGITLMGKIDFVAPLVQSCFLCCYAGLNFSCFLNSVVGSPSWRPRFKIYHPLLAMLGFLLATFLMFSGPWPFNGFSGLCVLLMVVIYLAVTWRGKRREFGDSINGLKHSWAVYNLFVPKSYHVNSAVWRPRVYCLGSDWQKLKAIVSVAPHLKLTPTDCAAVVVTTAGHADTESHREHVRREATDVRNFMRMCRLKSFIKMYIQQPQCFAQTHTELATLTRYTQCAKLTPNVLVTNLPSCCCDRQTAKLAYTNLTGRHTIIFAPSTTRTQWPVCTANTSFELMRGTIDVWCVAHAADLLVKIGVIVSQKRVWQECNVRLFVLRASNFALDEETIETQIKELLKHHHLNEIVTTVTVVNVEYKMLGAYSNRQTPYLRYRAWQSLAECRTRAYRTPHIQQMLDKHWVQLERAPEETAKTTRKEISEYRLRQACAIRKHIVHYSSESPLVIVNLPPAPRHPKHTRKYIRYATVLSASLKRVLLVNATQHENIIWPVQN